MEMIIIKKTQDLIEFCKKCASYEYVTLDTEFLRERTYYSKLCLVQMAHPGNTEDSAVLIDPLSTELSLEPLYELFKNPSVVKVFHAARQDLEIFFTDKKIIPFPFFDTQVRQLHKQFDEPCGHHDHRYEALQREYADEQCASRAL